MNQLEHLFNVQVFLCKFNRYTKALDAIFFESLTISGEYSLNELRTSRKELLAYERRKTKRQ